MPEVSNKKNTLLGLFKTIFPALKISSLKDFVNCETIWFILMNIDRSHFESAQNHAQYSLAGTLQIIGKYITSVFGVHIKSQVTVKLAQHEDWAWGTLLLYLMVMSEKREDTIGVILTYEPEVQTFFMELISETQQNFTQIQQKSPFDDDMMRKIQEMQIQIQRLKEVIKDKDDTIYSLRQDMISMKVAQQSLMETEEALKHEQYQLLDTIGVNTFDDLKFKHSAMLKENDKLKDMLETKDEEFKNIKELYHEASMNLESLLTTVQEQQNFTPEQKEELEKRRSTILSKKSLNYIQNIEMHCKPLLEDIAMLEKRNRLLEKQIKLLYKNFKHLLKELKPCREWGLLEDVPRVVF